jgi:hypothetical protein
MFLFYILNLNRTLLSTFTMLILNALMLLNKMSTMLLMIIVIHATQSHKTNITKFNA